MSINGANRLGSNSLPELLVFGTRAARIAAKFAQENGNIAVEQLRCHAEAEERRIRGRFFQTRCSKPATLAGLRTELNDVMEAGASIERDGPSLERACAAIADLKQRLDQVQLADRSRVFNTELTAALELEFLVDVAEAVVSSAQARTESRGAHQRLDFPDRDDQRFLKHSLAWRTEHAPRIDYLDVTITKWQPEERVYGRS